MGLRGREKVRCVAVLGVSLVVAGFGVVLAQIVGWLPCVGLDGFGGGAASVVVSDVSAGVTRPSMIGKLAFASRASVSVRR